MTIKLDGKRVAAEVKANLAERVSTLKEHGIVPGLGTLLVGEDPGSMKYVAGKHADCAEVGIRSIRRDLPADAKGRITFQQGDGGFIEDQSYWVPDPGDAKGTNAEEDWEHLERLKA